MHLLLRPNGIALRRLANLERLGGHPIERPRYQDIQFLASACFVDNGLGLDLLSESLLNYFVIEAARVKAS